MFVEHISSKSTEIRLECRWMSVALAENRLVHLAMDDKPPMHVSKMSINWFRRGKNADSTVISNSLDSLGQRACVKSLIIVQLTCMCEFGDECTGWARFGGGMHPALIRFLPRSRSSIEFTDQSPISRIEHCSNRNVDALIRWRKRKSIKLSITAGVPLP